MGPFSRWSMPVEGGLRCWSRVASMPSLVTALVRTVRVICLAGQLASRREDHGQVSIIMNVCLDTLGACVRRCSQRRPAQKRCFTALLGPLVEPSDQVLHRADVHNRSFLNAVLGLGPPPPGRHEIKRCAIELAGDWRTPWRRSTCAPQPAIRAAHVLQAPASRRCP